MAKTLRIVALMIALTVLLWWLLAGANRGWTKTSVAVTTVDEVTGIEGIAYVKRFVPGVDFLGGGLLGAGFLAALSVWFRKTQSKTKIEN